MWVFVWAGVNLFFTIMLFFGGNEHDGGIYRAMQIYMAFTTLMLLRTGVLIFTNVITYPEYYFLGSWAAALIAPAGAISSIYLAVKVWKAKR